MQPLPTYDELPRDESGAASAWGLFGGDDSLGRLNLITPEVVVGAVGLVRRGVTFGLNLSISEFVPPLDNTRAATVHRVLRGGRDGVEDLDDVLDDYFPQISSQWDSLAHIAAEPNVFYNGRSVEDVTIGGRNTIDHWASQGVVTRGVLLDVALCRQRFPDLVPDASHGSVALTVEHLEAARRLSGVEYSPGCAILIRTGFVQWYRTLDRGSRTALAASLTAPGLEHT